MTGLDEVTEAALAAIEASPEGWLDLPHRRRLRALLGPWTPPYELGGPDAGLLGRALLLVECVRRALPAWEATFPDDRRPHAIADAVMPALQREVPEAHVDVLAKALREDVEPLGVRFDVVHAFFAGEAACRISYEAWDGDLDPEFHPPEQPDTALDEPLVEACAAYAIGWEDPEALRAYWRWYVTEAFPVALRFVRRLP